MSDRIIGQSRRNMIKGGVIALSGLSLGSSGKAGAGGEEEISHTAEAIHQEPVFKVSRKRVYEVLTDAKQFAKVMAQSAAMQSGMAPKDKPAEISHESGGAFSLFGGYILGRHVELVPGERIVQAWRVAAWDAGVYSIARFELKEDGAGTKIVFDHTGFPVGQAQHLAEGWKANYWEPLGKYLGGGGD